MGKEGRGRGVKADRHSVEGGGKGKEGGGVKKMAVEQRKHEVEQVVIKNKQNKTSSLLNTKGRDREPRNFRIKME